MIPQSNATADKRTTLRDAIAGLVHDGDLVYAAGFTHLIPFAAGHEIIRQGRRNLTLARATPDIIYDQLIAAGCARKLIFSYAGNPGVGSLRVLRRAIEAGAIAVEEYSHFGMIARLWAGAQGLPFAPLRSNDGSDLPRYNPQIRSVVNPYDGEPISVVPALHPDVALVHVQRADPAGNAQIWGILGEQREAAFAARRVVVLAEEIVEPAVIRADPNRTIIPDFIVSAVVHAPWGCHPSHAQGYYDRDNDFYVKWDAISADPNAVQDYLDRYVYGVEDLESYVELVGMDHLEALKPGPRLSGAVNYGRY
jgi:glutaconate CoA-transferase subunit A